MTQHKRIFIIGHPGAGKGLLAKTVAENLGWSFVDADIGIEFLVGKTLQEIMGHEGAKSFLQTQFDILTSLTKKENLVITTDASVIDDEKNRQLLSSEFTVYLKVNTETQLARTARNPEPLLPDIDLKSFFDQLHARDHFYADVALLTIEGDDSALQNHVAKILDRLSTFDKENKITLDKKDLVLIHRKLHTPVHLSEQQAITLKLLSQGKTSKEIARDMHISYRTVEGHIKNMMELLGCATSKELISLYYE